MELKEWIGENNEIGIDIWSKKYCYENETLEEFFDRVSGINLNYKDDFDKAMSVKLRELIKDGKFLFAGRTLSNRGVSTNKGTYFNCYSMGYIEDDYNSIMQAAVDIGKTFRSQGGQGLSLSKIRPKGTTIDKRYKSDGIVPFMQIYNTVTDATSQGGHRKGALMISLDARHKESETFIMLKQDQDTINKANLSLEIDDEFMNAVKKYYETGEVVTLHEKRVYAGKHEIEYDIVPIELYKKLIQMNYDWAEPGALYVNQMRNYNILEFDDEYEIETTNPCGEQPLKSGCSCDLGSLNLSNYVKLPYTEKAYFDIETFKNDILVAVWALDFVLDENKNNHPLKIQSKNSQEWRNIGLGVMGYATALIMLGIKYGSDEAKLFTDNLFNVLFREAVFSSNKLASIKRPYPKYKECIFESRIMKSHFNDEEIEKLKRFGLRNCSLISIAPTGSISTMMQLSGGCEPEFAFKYWRTTKSVGGGEDHTYEMDTQAVLNYHKHHPDGELPDYFITSGELDWKDRIDVQAIMQKHVDTAISSTINLPNETTLEGMEKLYLYAWEKGLKGLTVFRDGCKRIPILAKSSNDEENSIIPKYDYITPESRKEIGKMTGATYPKRCACGTLYVTVNHNEDGNLLECFVHTSKNGICQSNINALTRMISVAMRCGISVNEIIDQLKGINCPACIKAKSNGNNLDGISCPDIISRVIQEEYSLNNKDENNEYNCNGECKECTCKKEESKKEDKTFNSKDVKSTGRCPECGEKIQLSEGCMKCLNCGWSKC